MDDQGLIWIDTEKGDSEESREKLSRYNQVKEIILKQITPLCICSEYYQREHNNNLSQHYFKHALEGTDEALMASQWELENVLKQDHTEYDTVKATALAIRYAIKKGFITVENK